MSNFYIASRLEAAAQVKRMANILVAAEHTHTYDWTAHGSVKHEGEQRIREVAGLEVQGVRDADVVIVILPGGRGTHAELGLAIATYKSVIICAADDEDFQQDERTCAFYWADKVRHVTGGMEDWLPVILWELTPAWRRKPVVGTAT